MDELAGPVARIMQVKYLIRFSKQITNTAQHDSLQAVSTLDSKGRPVLEGVRVSQACVLQIRSTDKLLRCWRIAKAA